MIGLRMPITLRLDGIVHNVEPPRGRAENRGGPLLDWSVVSNDWRVDMECFRPPPLDKVEVSIRGSGRASIRVEERGGFCSTLVRAQMIRLTSPWSNGPVAAVIECDLNQPASETDVEHAMTLWELLLLLHVSLLQCGTHLELVTAEFDYRKAILERFLAEPVLSDASDVALMIMIQRLLVTAPLRFASRQSNRAEQTLKILTRFWEADVEQRLYVDAWMRMRSLPLLPVGDMSSSERGAFKALWEGALRLPALPFTLDDASSEPPRVLPWPSPPDYNLSRLLAFRNAAPARRNMAERDLDAILGAYTEGTIQAARRAEVFMEELGMTWNRAHLEVGRRFLPSGIRNSRFSGQYLPPEQYDAAQGNYRSPSFTYVWDGNVADTPTRPPVWGVDPGADGLPNSTTGRAALIASQIGAHGYPGDNVVNDSDAFADIMKSIESTLDKIMVNGEAEIVTSPYSELPALVKSEFPNVPIELRQDDMLDSPVGYWVYLPNGWAVSVAFGPGTHSSNESRFSLNDYHLPPEHVNVTSERPLADETDTAELQAYHIPTGKWKVAKPLQYQTRSQALDFIRKLAQESNDDRPAE